jgi:hypothetical protein
MTHIRQTGVVLLLSIFWSFNLTSLAQQYQPIPDSNAVWDIVFFRDPAFPDLPPYHSHFKYSIKGDTVLDNLLYSKIFRTFINIHCSNDTSVSLYRFVRNDVINKKVYFYSIDNNAEELLYDFDLQTGDTLKGAVFLNTNFTVGVIDSIPIHDVFHKRYEILINNYFFQYYLIEGIGTSLGLFERVVEFWPIHDLRFFTLDGSLAYTSQNAIACELETDTCFVDVKEVSETRGLKVFPNPVNNVLNIEINDRILKNTLCNLSIYDLYARCLLNIDFYNNVQVNLSSFMDGVFFYQINFKGSRRIYNGKLILYKDQ